MADTFKNPYNYTSPIGAALADLTRTIVSGPSRAEKIAAAENMLKIKRYNENLLATQEGLRGFGTPTFNLPDVAASAIGAGVSGADLGDYNMLLTANGADSLTDPAIDLAQRGAGGAYSGTYAGFSEDQGNQNMRAANTLAETHRNNVATLGENARQFDQKPFTAIGDSGRPEVFTNLTAVGRPANVSETDMKGALLGENFANLGALSPEQQTVLGARGTTAPTPRNYANPDGTVSITYDGITDAQTGQRLVPGGVVVSGDGAAGDAGLTTSVRGGVQSGLIDLGILDANLGAAEQLVTSMPDSSFGLSGNIQQWAQDAVVLADNLAQGLNMSSASEAISAFQQEAASAGVDPGIISGLYDARFPERSSLYMLLGYAAAKALSGGGVLSDQDVKAGLTLVGDPNGLFESKQSLLAKINQVKGMNQRKRGVLEGAMGGSVAPAAAPTGGPQPGTVEDGYRFKGGDPADPANWEAAQ